MEETKKPTEDKIVLGKKKNANPEIPAEFIDQEFKVLTDDVELPSLGTFYPTGQKTVKVKYLTAEEDDILFSPELLKSGKVLDALLQIAVVDPTLTAEDMLVGDRNTVLIHLRKNGLGNMYNPGLLQCPSCKEEYDPDIDLNKLKLKYLEDKPNENGEYDFTMPLMKSKIKFRFLNGHDENKLMKSGKSTTKKKGSSYKISKIVTERYRLQIMEVDGNRDKIYISRFVSAMPMKDSLTFREYVRLVSPGVDFNYSFECKNCGHVYEDDVPLTPKLFYPNADI